MPISAHRSPGRWSCSPSSSAGCAHLTIAQRRAVLARAGVDGRRFRVRRSCFGPIKDRSRVGLRQWLLDTLPGQSDRRRRVVRRS